MCLEVWPLPWSPSHHMLLLSIAHVVQVEATMSGLHGEAELASGAWTNASLADADIIFIEEGEAHKVMQRHPDKKFIVVQQPVHATLAAIMESYGTCVLCLVLKRSTTENLCKSICEMCCMTVRARSDPRAI